MENLAEVFDEQAVLQKALDNFDAILETADYSSVLEMLGIGRLQFVLRKQMVGELKGLYTALWRLALDRSFPEDSSEMFAAFLKMYVRKHPGKAAENAMERAAQYWGMLEPGGDGDFSLPARHLISFLVKTKQDTRVLTLKIALHLRKIYRMIFERLI